jgi:hypothetical protein
VMRAAERDGEFVARFAAERPRLQVAKMMRIGLFAAADETRLLGDIAKVLPVAIAPRSTQIQGGANSTFVLTSTELWSRLYLMNAQELRRLLASRAALSRPTRAAAVI